MAVNYLQNVPRLLGRENFADWSFALENVFVLEGLSKCLDGSETDTVLIAKAKAKLILTLDPSIYVHVKSATSAKEIWDTLKQLYEDTGFTRKIGLLRNLISLRFDDCDSMENFINQVVDTSQKLQRTGFDISEEWIGSILLAGLPVEKFGPMIMAIEHSGIKITTDNIKTKLLDLNVGAADNAGVAFASKFNRGNRNYRVGNNVGSGIGSSGSYVKNDLKCYGCKQTGHFRNKCPNRNKNEKKGQTVAFNVAFLTGSFSKNDWYVDSAASSHITALEDQLQDVSASDVKELLVADNGKVEVTCKGNVSMQSRVGKKTYDIVIRDALCAPTLATNLLSVSQLCRSGYSVNFSEKTCEIHRDKELLATADLVDNVYRLNFNTSSKKIEKCYLATANTWHRRLGHINFKDLQKMSNGVVDGLICKGKIEREDCITCCEGKQTRLPFHTGTRAKGLLEVVHADLCGPMEVTSIGGSRYFLILEDDFSRMCFIYFLKSKDESLQYFKEFKSMVENQKNVKIKCFRSDNGGEFCSKAFDDYLKKNGIIHQTTNSYTPEQNGLSERMNRTIVEKARCMLFDSKLEKRFWAEAVNTAIYVRNRSIASGLNERTPYEVWTGNKPNLSHLKIFGSTVMVHVPKEKRRKFDKKSKEMILMGYGETVKGYRIFDPEKNIVITSRDIVVMEETKEKEVLIQIEQEVSLKETDENLKEENLPEIEHEVSLDSVGEVIDTSDNTIDSDDIDFVPENLMPISNDSHLRRSTRQPKAKKYDDYVAYMCTGANQHIIEMDREPVTVQEALSRPDSKKWKEAMENELQSFSENEAWDLVDPPQEASVVGNKWVFKRKVDSVGNVCYRARLVAKGFTQIEGIDFDETFSPVVRYSTLRLLFALSVKFDLDITHLDICTAFLNGFLDKPVFMSQPEGFVDPKNSSKVCSLKRAVYGLKQSSRAWNIRINDFLLELGYKRSKFEPCVFLKCFNNSMTFIALYVDDFFIFSNNTREVEMLKTKLSTKFKLKDLGQVKQCLGMNVNINKVDGYLTLDQRDYIDQLLAKFNMKDSKTTDTPMENNLSLEKGQSTSNLPFQKLIGSLMFLSVMTRPDISYSVSYLSQFNNSFNETHWNHAKRILKYLQKTKSFCLKYVKNSLDLKGFVDADWGSNIIDRRSFTGFCFKLSGAVISWQSSKQKTVALSSTEAEYMALAEASKEALYLRNLIKEFTDSLCCIDIFNDSQSAQKLAYNPVFHKRTKHIDVRYHFIRDAVLDNKILLKYLETNSMPADMLTKALGSKKHYTFLEMLGVVDK